MSGLTYGQDISSNQNQDAADLNLEDCKIPVFATYSGFVKKTTSVQGRLTARSRDGGEERLLGQVDFVKLTTYDELTGTSTDYPMMYASSLKLSPEQYRREEVVRQGQLVGCGRDDKTDRGPSFFSPEN